MKRVFVFVFVLLPVALMLTGCQGSSNSSPPASSASLPPDPGADGNLTIEGIDSDADGVRDDVQRYIATTYEDVPTQKALTQFFKAQQSLLLANGDKEKVLDGASKVDRAVECVFYLGGEDAVKIIRDSRAFILNTEERTLAYFAADQLAGGETFPSVNIRDLSNSCE